MTFAHRRACAQDVVLAMGIALGLATSSALGGALALACAVALAFGVATLHFPWRVEVTDDMIAFHAYGRAHRFVWRDVERVRVRRFLTGDRVLVRISPSRAWRGRYWIVASIDGYDTLVRELESRAAGAGAPTARATPGPSPRRA
jgi:hypothetical protein